MFSATKILALLVILGAVWYGFKLVGRLDEARRRKADLAARGDAERSGPRPSDRTDGVVDLVKDESGAYVAKDKRNDRV